MHPPIPFVVVALALALVAALSDARKGIIPNKLVMPFVLLAPLAHGAYGGWQAPGTLEGALWAAGMSLAGAAACSLVPLFLFSKGAIGGGDVKLFAALGALCLPMMGIEVQLYGFVAGAAMAQMQMLRRGRLGQTLTRSLRLLRGKADESGEATADSLTWFRLGPSIFTGLTMVASQWW